MGFDKEQYHMVSEALQERANLVDIAPHLAYALPIMLPVYTYWQIPYFWAGIKVSGANLELGNLESVQLVILDRRLIIENDLSIPHRC